MAGLSYYIEISPLSERAYTGIAQVTAAIAREAIDSNRDVKFFFGRTLIDRSIIETLIKIRDGGYLSWCLARNQLKIVPHHSDFSKSVGIFLNKKTAHGIFDFEAQFVHDLSPLLTPEFHTIDTVRFHNSNLKRDIATNDLFVCDSNATAEDVRAYLPGVRADKVMSLKLSYDLNQNIQRYLDQQKISKSNVDPFAVVLGTLEPRKNVGEVLRFISRNRWITKDCKFVFVGRIGWGDSVDSIISDLNLNELVENGDIIFTGFVSESAKQVLLRLARVVIYPSIFEGFGLPVLEALASGTRVVTTSSSSIPEAGGECCFYFDPFQEADIDRAVISSVYDKSTSEEKLKRERWILQFDWRNSFSYLTTEIERRFNIKFGNASSPRVLQSTLES